MQLLFSGLFEKSGVGLAGGFVFGLGEDVGHPFVGGGQGRRRFGAYKRCQSLHTPVYFCGAGDTCRDHGAEDSNGYALVLVPSPEPIHGVVADPLGGIPIKHTIGES